MIRLWTVLFLLMVAFSGRASADDPAAWFRDHCLALAEAAEKDERSVVIGDDGWLFLPAELRHIAAGKFWGAAAATVSRATNPEQADPLPAVLDFKSQLDRIGVELWLMPVPPKALVHADRLMESLPQSRDAARLDREHQAFYQLLRDKGVKVIDLTDELIDSKDEKAGSAYCRQDTHWSGVTCVRAARRIADELKDAEWASAIRKLKLRDEVRQVEITGDLLRLLDDAPRDRERLPLRFVTLEESNQPVQPNRSSPILLMGDSHTLIFHAGGDMHAEGAGLADQLAFELEFVVDLIGVKGSGATPARVNLLRRVRAEPDYLAKKKLVIWCFAAREFTQSPGWAKVPVVR